MSKTEFFLGDRITDEFEVAFHGGKARLSCTTIEKWEEQISRSIRCGTEFKRTLTQRFGVASIEREDLEATISTSLGLKGIAELKSEIKGKIGRELHLEYVREVEEEFSFQAPECGRFTILVYQLKRIYHFCFQDTRFLHRDSWTKTITEWTNRVHDASKRTENDPACGCNKKINVGIEDILYLSLDRISMLVGYKHANKEIEFPTLETSIETQDIRQLLSTDLIFDRDVIPAHLLFLSGEDSSKLHGRFAPYMEEWSTDSSKEEYGVLSEPETGLIIEIPKPGHVIITARHSILEAKRKKNKRDKKPKRA